MTIHISPEAQRHGAAPLTPRLHELALLSDIERRILWLSSWMIHHANHIPAAGETIAIDGTEFVVVAGDDRKIERLRVPLRDAEPAPQQGR